MRRPLLLALVTTAFLLAGCGTSGGDTASTDAKDTASTTAADSGSPTGDDETTTTAKSGGRSVTSADLEAILPTAADIGPDYTLKEPEDASATTTTTTPDDADPVGKAIEDACPKAKQLDLMSEEVNDDEVRAEFETEDTRGFEVDLDPTPKGISEGNMDQIIEAFNDCGTVEATDPDMGKISMTLAAKPLEGVGDYGADVTLDASFELFGAPVTLSFHGYLFVVDGVGVSVTATSGIDPTTFTMVPAEEELLAPVSAEMEQRVRSL